MSELDFIVRCKGGTERKSIAIAAQRVRSAWLPFQLHSQRYGRGKTRRSDVEARPIMPYMFCTGTGDQMRHLLDHKHVFSTVWFIPNRSLASIAAYKVTVEAAFTDARIALANDARLFHCTYKAGDQVLEEMGQELIPATFEAMTNEGMYKLDINGLNFASKIEAEPTHVRVAI